MRVALLFCLLLFPSVSFAAVDHAHGIALHGEPKYKADFTQLDYVNPDAPKGGELRQAVVGDFDSMNNFILKGESGVGLGLIYQSLMENTLDEASAEYGLIAESVSYPDDRSWVSFTLRKEARFSDGKPVTADDVIWSFDILRSKGHPYYRAYYNDVAKAEKIGDHEVKFIFSKSGNTELPHILGQLPVIPKHDWEKRKFEETTLEKPIGSGPYVIESVDPGHSITYARVKDWWGDKLPINKGRYNFDRIRYDYYYDATVSVEAFLAGKYDVKLENIAKQWATAYSAPVVAKGQVKKEEIKNQIPSGMQAFAMNQRRALFQNPKVREALAYAFDFEWSNKSFAYGAYKRTRSFFQNSELAATELPSAEEIALLEPFRAQLPPQVFTEIYQPPKTDGSGSNRANIRKAAALLAEAGWTLKDKKLVNAKGEPFKFEITVDQPAFERWILPFVRNLERLGIEATPKTVASSAQYQNRLDNFDYDMIVQVFPQSLTPGNEQRDYWHSSKADINGSRNILGIRNPVVDAFIEKLIMAKDRKELITICRALDRVLQWNFYVIPHWHTSVFRVAYWDKFGRPSVNPPYGLPIADTWWVDPSKVAPSK
jgi:microcin C transport system substrate-binding protein